MATSGFKLILMMSCGFLMKHATASEENLANQGITDLSSLTFPTSTTILILNDNPLLEIPAGIFQNLTDLTSLSLATTQLVDSSMTRESFLGLGSITKVSTYMSTASSTETGNTGRVGFGK